MDKRSYASVKDFLSRQETRRAFVWGGAEAAAMGAVALFAILRFPGDKDDIGSPLVGIDISFPQGDSGQELPDSPNYVVVGVTAGRSTQANPHLVEQLRYANEVQEFRTEILEENAQPPIQLYMNTANPGEMIDQVETWPENNAGIDNEEIKNPYGTCDGTNSLACSWQYGWNRAQDVVSTMFRPAATSANIDQDPKAYPWWLDVETGNTWQSGSREALARNAASLEGTTAYLQSIDCNVGIYSTHYQWEQIVGDEISENSNLNGLESWLAGAESQPSAEEMCSLSAFTKNGEVVLVQFTENNLGYNVACN